MRGTFVYAIWSSKAETDAEAKEAKLSEKKRKRNVVNRERRKARHKKMREMDPD